MLCNTRRRFSREQTRKIQVMPLRKPHFYREIWLNVVVYRVKTPALSFLYCTPRWSWRFCPTGRFCPRSRPGFSQALAYRSALRHSVVISN